MTSFHARRLREAPLGGSGTTGLDTTRRRAERKRLGWVQQVSVEARGRLDPIKTDDALVGRNDPCPCGSSKKAKRCCRG